MKLLTFIIFYILIIFSVIGYGFIFRKIIGQKNTSNIGYSGLYGIFFITFLVYLQNYFLPISNLTNLLIHTIGIILFYYFYKKNYFFRSNELILLFIILFLTLFFILSAKPHDDFEYYHFPYINLLNNESLLIGIGNFNHGFRTPSSIFYFSSTFYLPIIKYEIIHIGSAFFLIFANLILLEKLIINKKNFSKFILILNLLTFSIINIFFYRMGEHGTDKSAQILMFLFIIEFLIILNHKKINLDNISNSVILIVLAASLKAIYLIYLIFFIIFIYYSSNKINFILKIVKSKIFVFTSVFVLFVLSIYFINTGCLIYPLSFTCNDNLVWSIPIVEVKQMNQWYQLWSKAGASPGFSVTNPEIYINNFYWVSHWLNHYFFNKVSDYIYGLLFLLFIVFVVFYKSSNNKLFLPKYWPVYSIIIILLLEWFANHPALRYGGYHLFALIFFIPFSIYLSNKTFENKKLYSKIFLVIILTSAVFVARNVHRISKEYKQYNYNIFVYPSYDKRFENYSIYSRINDAKNCSMNACGKGSVVSKKFIGKNVFFINK